MKTKEFIKAVEALGLTVDVDDEEIVVNVGYYEYTVSVINRKERYTISNTYLGWRELDGLQKSYLFELINDYASTPVDEREEEKKFLIQHKYLVSKNMFPVNIVWHRLKDVYRLINCKVDNHIYQAQFTRAEIEEIKEKYNTDLNDFEIVEVEE